MGYNCDSDDGKAAVIIMTNLDSGDGLAFCGDCFTTWIRVTYDALTDGPDAPVAQMPTDPETGDDTDEDADLDECPVCGAMVEVGDQAAHWAEYHDGVGPDQLVAESDSTGAQGGGAEASDTAQARAAQ